MRQMHLLLYSGVSLLSRAIQWQTWSRWNHVALVMPDYRIIDAWKGGVRIIDEPYEGHAKSTQVMLADVKVPYDVALRVWDLALGQVGKRYAYGQLLGFLRRRTPRAYRGQACATIDPDEIKRFVCSGLIQYAFCRNKWPLVDKPWYKTDPSDIEESTRLTNRRMFHGDWAFWRDVWQIHDAGAR
jgi:uncharacterized protein YycO